MSDAPDTVADRDTDLTNFARARGEFEAAFSEVPNEAIGYRPTGDDYALGGLVVHVTEVLDQYGHVLDAMRAAGFGPVRVGPGSDEGERRLPGTVEAGFERHERQAVFEAMRSAHDRLAATVRALSTEDYARPASVSAEDDAQPYEARAADIVGWMNGHYRDHARQAADLLAGWKASSE